ncbi:response regulator transcription factor [Paenibacillus segetis]|uniref:DNA-binding response regulator n=1 Tax=Paenibacillus segetis TaxID=1325360 RepID=A0ABQ1YN39_9BACL|nr:response regulator transcription factor [Paenibacillus segetis]GGH31561.1 DNA-binding response regulator [Paenibacillus segetis]
MIQILLADDHPSVMEGTRVMLEQEEDMEVCLANSAQEVLELVSSNTFDVMLLDLYMADDNGIELAKQVLTMHPDAIILIYTGFDIYDHFNLMIETGIHGFILKTMSREQLITTIRYALKGEVILPTSLVRQLRRTTLKISDGMEGETPTISNREYIILKEITKGRSNREIAEYVLMSQRSLEYCLTKLFQRLNVKSRIEAVMKAKQLGILTDSDLIQ